MLRPVVCRVLSTVKALEGSLPHVRVEEATVLLLDAGRHSGALAHD